MKKKESNKQEKERFIKDDKIEEYLEELSEEIDSHAEIYKEYTCPYCYQVFNETDSEDLDDCLEHIRKEHKSDLEDNAGVNDEE